MPLAAVPVELGSTVLWTVPEEIQKGPCTWTFASGWASAKVLVKAKALELESIRPHLCRAMNPDPG